MCATADCKAKLTSQVTGILTEDGLTPQQAGVLAGKFGFVASSLFGQLARPVLHAIYLRQKAASLHRDIQALTPAVRASLTFLVEVLMRAPPRRVDVTTVQGTGIAYADAFFEMGDTGHRPADAPMAQWTSQSATSLANGWGVVVRCPTTGVTRYACGVVPTRVLQRFTLRRQYIFLLETLAQCLASWLFYHELGQWYLSFVDNTASQWALTKGYSRDPEANCIVGLFWTSAAPLGSHPWFERAGTNAQLADGVSRNDFVDAKRLNWKRLNADFTEVWEVVVASVEQHVAASRNAAVAIMHGGCRQAAQARWAPRHVHRLAVADAAKMYGNCRTYLGYLAPFGY